MKEKYFKLIVLTLSLFVIAIYLYTIYSNIFVFYTRPIHSDEYGYYLELKSFLDTGILYSPLTLDELYSKIGEFSFHGFSYTLFYSLFSYLFFTDDILKINIVLSILSLVFIFFMTKELKMFWRVVVISTIVSYSVFFLYQFSYMVEQIHLFFSVIVIYTLHKIFYSQKNQKTYINIFIFLVFMLSLMRITWLLFYITIFFFPKITKRKVFIYLLIVSILSSISLLNMYFFYAPYPSGFLTNLFQNPPELWFNLLYNHALKNIELYLFKYNTLFYFTTKILFLLILLYSLFISIYKNNSFLLTLSIVATLYFLFLILFYDTFAWRELRNLAVVYLSLLVALSIEKEYSIISFVFFIQFIIFFQALEDYRDDRVDVYTKKITLNREDERLINEISKLTSDQNTILITFDNRFFGFFGGLDFNNIFLKLPLKGENKTHLKYSINYFKNFDQNRTKTDFFISRKRVKSLKPFFENRDFFIYKLKD